MQCPYSLVWYFCVLTTWLYWIINIAVIPTEYKTSQQSHEEKSELTRCTMTIIFFQVVAILGRNSNRNLLGLIIIHWMTDLICGHWIIDCIFTIPRAVLKSTAPISCISCHKIRLRNYFKCGRCGDVFKSRPLVDKTPPETTKSTEGEELGESSNQKKGTMSHDTLGINTITPTSNGEL